MCNCNFIGCFCVVFHCNTYELYRPFSIQIVIHIGLNLFIQYQYGKALIGAFKVTGLIQQLTQSSTGMYACVSLHVYYDMCIMTYQLAIVVAHFVCVVNTYSV